MTRGQSPSFGALLKRLRLAAGLTQEALAERAQVSAKAVSELERDPTRAPRLDTVRLLADALQLDAQERAQLLAAARPGGTASRSLPPDQAPFLVVPRPLSPLIGREGVAAALVDLLGRDAPRFRLLTLTGPGGVGKTRLAIEVANRAAHLFADGVIFVDLAPLHDSRLVIPAVAKQLGVRQIDSTLPQRLADSLQGKRLLLLLDNFEHVMSARDDVLDLIRACPDLTVVVTSRMALRLRGEREYRIAPLALPQEAAASGTLEESPAVELFVDRAEASGVELTRDEGTVEAVAEVCRRLDGLPLAIELAAAWTALLPLPVLLARLEHRLPLLVGGPHDLPARQKTMRDAIAWSYDLLDPPERTLFRRLSVFVAGCTVEAARVVCMEPEMPETAALRGLAALLDKSLLRRQDGPAAEPRLSMLETIREYACERLEAEEDADAVHRRHLEYHVALAETAREHLVGSEQLLWLDRLEGEQDNLRAALTWALQRGESELGLRLAAALWRFWETRGLLTEGRRWLGELLAADDRVPPGKRAAPAARAAALYAAGVLAFDQSDYASASELYGQSLDLFRGLGARKQMGATLNGMGLVATELGDLAAARALLEDALALRREVGDSWGMAATLNNLGGVARNSGDFRAASRHYQESAALFRQLGDAAKEAMPLANLGEVSRASGDYESARRNLERAHALFAQCGDAHGMGLALENLAGVFRDQGELERAYQLDLQSLEVKRRLGAPRDIALSLTGAATTAWYLGDYERARGQAQEALHIFRSIGERQETAETLRILGALACAQGDLPEARRLYLEALDLFEASGFRLGTALCLEGLAAVAARTGDAERAARLLGGAAGWREKMGAPLPPISCREHDGLETQLRDTLGAAEFERAWAEGRRSLTSHQAITP